MLECCQKDGANVVMPSNLGTRSAIYTSGVTGRRWDMWCWGAGERQAGALLGC